ncbi:MAG: cobalt ECF transporter T component CbiQ [Elusimicrobia bacterium]|nr:cobalt ECF transporter T component CbiQ [Elusimicrobiota bacterium]
MDHLYIDKYSDLNSFIHRLDPRIKLISFLIMIIFIILTPPSANIQFFGYFLVTFLIIFMSKVPILHFLKSLYSILPFVILIVIFVPFLGGNGLIVFKNVLIKAFLSILILTILSATSKFQELLKGLDRLKLPKVFILILAFMYRYIFVLIDEKMRAERAIASKYFGKKIFLQFKVLGHIIGSLFINTFERAERIYIAMCSRLFDGEIKTQNNLKIKLSDTVFLIIFITILFGIKFL